MEWLCIYTAPDDLSEHIKKLGITPLNQQLGAGAYGREYKVTHSDVAYTIKEIRALFSFKHAEKFEQECIHCSELVHPNIVCFIGLYYSTSESLLAISWS